MEWTPLIIGYQDFSTFQYTLPQRASIFSILFINQFYTLEIFTIVNKHNKKL